MGSGKVKNGKKSRQFKKHRDLSQNSQIRKAWFNKTILHSQATLLTVTKNNRKLKMKNNKHNTLIILIQQKKKQLSL